jgi:hypothetical protein
MTIRIATPERLAHGTSVRQPTTSGSVAAAEARIEAKLVYNLIAPITRTIPNGPEGYLFDLGTEFQVNTDRSNPADGYETDVTYTTVFRWLYQIGRGDIFFGVVGRLLGNYGNRTWTLIGEVGIPGAFSKPVPDPPLLTFGFSTRTQNTSTGLLINGSTAAPAPPVVGLEARLRLIHDGINPLDVEIDQVDELQSYGATGQAVTI